MKNSNNRTHKDVILGNLRQVITELERLSSRNEIATYSAIRSLEMRVMDLQNLVYRAKAVYVEDAGYKSTPAGVVNYYRRNNKITGA